MKVVILAGGDGTRIAEETEFRPKPMVEIGGMPILWHILKEYSYYGYNEFIICAGYRQHIIKQWFADYMLYTSDVTFDLADNNRMTVHSKQQDPWRVTIVDTGRPTKTGDRIKAVRSYLGDEPFMMTYGDGVCDVDIRALESFHKQHGKIATLTAVRMEQDKGVLDIDPDNTVKAFREKERTDGALINAGYMVLEPAVFSYIDKEENSFESDVLPVLAAEEQLMSYQHTGFWQCMDTARDKMRLERLLQSGNAPWKKW